ncbi:MAG: hypothetical protein DHS20C14_15580 [Phycisphaeraceae bacterium]|nr:MAG: hypothetical protein DHS20C14_15580 [Phycisphaeraceae bacterium]
MAKKNTKHAKPPNKGEFRDVLDPKLQMLRNGSSRVNLARAQQCSALGASRKAALDTPSWAFEEISVRQQQLTATRGKLAELSDDVMVNVFVALSPDAPAAKLPGQTGRRADFATLQVPISRVDEISEEIGVMHVELGQAVRVPHPRVRLSSSTGDGISLDDPLLGPPTHAAAPTSNHTGGAGILIGIIDVQGFDFAHDDFLNADGTTRFEAIWDMGGDSRPPPATTGMFTYGSELLKQHMDVALQESPTVGASPTDLEPQSQMTPGSHATHVASIAAGNTGVCPNAQIVGVLIDLPPEDADRRRSFYDSTRIAHAVEYVLAKASELGCQGVSINISLGTNGHAHDGSSAVSRWIDHALATPGRSVCVAAGNAGQEAPTANNEFGYIMGRIHTEGRIPASGLNRDLSWVVFGDGIADLSENELELWYEPQDRFSVRLRPPGSDEWLPAVAPGQFIENKQLDDGTFVSVYNERYHPANGCNRIAVYLSPFLSPNEVVGVKAGTWTVRIEGDEVRDGRYHAWIERDDPRNLGRHADTQYWRFPSFFSTETNVDRSSVSSLACGHRVVSVANLDQATERPNISSSQGPTRDGRFKPDVAARGTEIVAANGFDPDRPWIAMTGTSMASPYAAGVVGLMLGVEPALTAAQINGIIRRTANPLPSTSYDWRDDAGFGRINPDACVKEARRAFEQKDLFP